MKKTAYTILTVALLLTCCTKETVDPYVLKFYGDAFEDIGNSVAIASDGYLIAGQFENLTRTNGVIVDGSANKNMALIKTDWNGNVTWKRSYGGANADMGSRVYQLPDGSMVCVGTFTDTSTVDYKGKEVFLVKVSADGDLIWKKVFNEKGDQTGRDIIETPSGFLIVGTTDMKNLPVTASSGNPEGKTDIFIIKTDAAGTLIDTLRRGFPGNETVSAIRKDAQGNYIILGTTETPSNPSKMHDLFFIKLNQGGAVIDSKVIGTNDDEYSTDLEVKDDGYIISAVSGSSASDQYALVMKFAYNLNLAPSFSNKFKVDNNSTSVNSITPYGQDNFILGGSTLIGSERKMLILEIDDAGELVSGNKLVKGSSGEQVVNDVVTGDDGYIIAVGRNKYDINSMISFFKVKF